MTDAIRIETGVPGHPIDVEEIDGVLVERNGAGSIVAHVYPDGVDFDEPERETLPERVKRLTRELREARAALKAATA